MNPGSNEIEMQMYALHFGQSVNYPRALPYYWEGENELPVACPEFVLEEQKEPGRPANVFMDDEMDTGHRQEVHAPPQPSPMPMPSAGQLESRGEMGGPASLESMSTEGANSLNARPSPSPSLSLSLSPSDGIDQQLSFILDSIRKQKKKEPTSNGLNKKGRRARQRKTLAQLDFLQSELRDSEVLDKPKMKYLAERTGLTESQVYKWFWDHRRKKEQQPSS